MLIKFTSCCVLFLFLLVLGFTSVTLAQETTLNDKRISIRMTNEPLGIVFRYLIGTYDIPIGFEESTFDYTHDDYDFEVNHPYEWVETRSAPDGKSKITLSSIATFAGKERLLTLDFNEARLELVLNAVVDQMKHYQWEINNGVVNIFPKEGRDERFKELLSKNIDKFKIEKGQSVRAITTKILELPEVKRFLADNHLNFNGHRGGSVKHARAQYDRPLPAEINLSHISFRELLNRATVVKRGGWILRKKRYPLTEEHIDIDI